MCDGVDCIGVCMCDVNRMDCVCVTVWTVWMCGGVCDSVDCRDVGMCDGVDCMDGCVCDGVDRMDVWVWTMDVWGCV